MYREFGCEEMLIGAEGPYLYLGSWNLNCTQKEPIKDVRMESASPVLYFEKI